MMTEAWIDQQLHGYRSGHQLLAGSAKLSRLDQDIVDRLSDMAGPLRPGEKFSPYLSAYPLPSDEYYVLARTWQDLGAPRAGCVLTRSLLVPMPFWGDLENLSPLLALLQPFDRSIRTTSRLEIPQSGPMLPTVEDPRAPELVEALFLETRRPVVMFDTPEAEAIAWRLLTAFWPSLRQSFCVCTFALAPRTLEGREFDLLFAPKTAHSRFTEWAGRRIEAAAASGGSARHRWTIPTTKQIFQSTKPNLIASDSLGVLQLDNRGDESALRLSLLWNELLERSETSPTATLGLLDILNSRQRVSSETLGRITPLLERAVTLATSSPNRVGAWQFLVTLLGKFHEHIPPSRLIRQLWRTSRTLAQAGPGAAFEFLKQQDAARQSVPMIILGGLGDGLARLNSLDDFLEDLEHLLPETGLGLVALSQPFARRITRQVNPGASPAWARVVATMLESPDIVLRKRARRAIVPVLDNPAQTPLLSALLIGADAETLGYITATIWAKTRFKVAEFDEPLCRAARDNKGMLNLRAVIAGVEEIEASNRFLLNTLQLDAADIAWLCTSTLLSRGRVLSLLMALLSRVDDRSVQSLVNDANAYDLLLETLLRDVGQSAMYLARLLLLGQLPIQPLLRIGFQVLPHLVPSMKLDLRIMLLSRGLAEASSTEDGLIGELIRLGDCPIDPDQLIRLATVPKGTAARIGSNLVILNRTETVLRNLILARVDGLTERLVHRGIENLGEPAFTAWASMLTDAQHVDRAAQLRAAGLALPHALRLLNAAVSPVIVSAFPLVYAELKAGRDYPTLWSIFSFVDWDRCKIARRDLVNAFMAGSWPPADLLLTATNAGEAQRILERVARERGGQRYLARLEQDLSRLPDETRIRLYRELASFRGNGPGFADFGT